MKIISKARQLRLDYQAKLGKPVTAEEVSIATGITRTTLSRIERGETQAIGFDTLAKLCSFYGVGVGDLLEFSTEDIEEPELALA